jgi:hypothetical protein
MSRRDGVYSSGERLEVGGDWWDGDGLGGVVKKNDMLEGELRVWSYETELDLRRGGDGWVLPGRTPERRLC